MDVLSFMGWVQWFNSIRCGGGLLDRCRCCAHGPDQIRKQSVRDVVMLVAESKGKNRRARERQRHGLLLFATDAEVAFA